MNLKFKLTALVLTSSLCYGGLFDFVTEAVDAIGIKTGAVKVEDRNPYMSPPMPIKNTSEYGNHFNSDMDKSNFNSYSDFLASPTWGTYDNLKSSRLDTLKTFDDEPKNINVVSNFYKKENYPKDIVTVSFNISNNTKSDGSKIGPSPLRINIHKINELDNLNNEDIIIKVTLDGNKSINELTRTNLKHSVYGFKFDEVEKRLDKNGKAYVKIEIKIPYLKKKYYQLYEVDTMKYKDKRFYERVALIEENISEPLHPDDVKQIPVYLSELAGVSPYGDLNSNIVQFLKLNPGTIIYKDHGLKKFNESNKKQCFIPIKGYMTPCGVAEFDSKNGMTLTHTVNGETVTTSNSLEHFLNNFALKDDNQAIAKGQAQSFAKNWNDMILKSPGFGQGGVILFQNNEKEIGVNPKEIFKQNGGFSFDALSVVTDGNYNFEDFAQDYNNFFESLPSSSFGWSQEDTDIDQYTYILMSWNEYAATWGLTATDAKKLFYFNQNNRLVWKIDGLRKYFRDHYYTRYITMNDKNQLLVEKYLPEGKVINYNEYSTKELDELMIKMNNWDSTKVDWFVNEYQNRMESVKRNTTKVLKKDIRDETNLLFNDFVIKNKLGMDHKFINDLLMNGKDDYLLNLVAKTKYDFSLDINPATYPHRPQPNDGKSFQRVIIEDRCLDESRNYNFPYEKNRPNSECLKVNWFPKDFNIRSGDDKVFSNGSRTNKIYDGIYEVLYNDFKKLEFAINNKNKKLFTHLLKNYKIDYNYNIILNAIKTFDNDKKLFKLIIDTYSDSLYRDKDKITNNLPKKSNAYFQKFLRSKDSEIVKRQNELVEAIKSSDKLKTWQLMTNGTRTFKDNKKLDTELNIAVQYSTIDFVKFLLNTFNLDFEVNNAGKKGITPLIQAAKYNKIDSAKALLNSRTQLDTDVKDSAGLSAFNYAKKNNFTEIINLINNAKNNKLFIGNIKTVSNALKDGADVNFISESEGGDTPLIYQISINKLDIVKLLLINNADKEIKNKKGLNALEQLHAWKDKLSKQYKTDDYSKIFDKYEKLLKEDNIKELLKDELYDILSAKKFILLEHMILHDVISPNYKLDKKFLKQFKKQGISSNASLFWWLCTQKTTPTSIIDALVKKGADVDEKDKAGVTPLMFLINNSINPNIVKTLIQNGANVNQTFNGNVSLLSSATAGNDLEMVKILVENGADVNAQSDAGDTPLIECAYNTNNSSLASFLIKKGADVNMKNYKYKSSALYYAVQKNHMSVAKVLISNNVDINVKTKGDWTPLMIAAKKGYENFVRLLIENKADPYIVNKSGDTALTIAMKKGHKQVVKYLNLSNKDSKDSNMLLFAAANGDLDMIRSELENGTDVNSRFDNGETALMHAVKNDHTQAAILLLYNGANAQMKTNDGKRAIDYIQGEFLGGFITTKSKDESIRVFLKYDDITDKIKKDIQNGLTNQGNEFFDDFEGYIETLFINFDNDIWKDKSILTVIYDAISSIGNNKDIRVPVKTFELLKSKGVDINQKDIDGYSPLTFASTMGNYDAVKYLLENRADINSKNYKGRTPIYQSIHRGHNNITKLLIQKGADVNNKDDEKLTPLMMASFLNKPDIIKLLLDNRADVNAKDHLERTSLLFASEKGNYEVVKLLADNGADINYKLKSGISALSIAQKFNHRKVVEFLKQKGAK